MSIRNLFDYSQPLVAAATILSASALVIAFIGSYTVYTVKHASDSLVVTGSAKESVVADYARLTIHLQTSTSTYDQQAGVNRLETATQKIVAYLNENGYTDNEALPVSSYTEYSYPEKSSPVFTGYSINRDIIVRSNDVDGMSTLGNNIQPFTGAGYHVTIQSIELTYSKLDEMRVSLLREAIKDAKARAEAIAGESGRRVGMLRTASSGVVQVLPKDGIDISDYGSYDTQSKNKDIMVTVRATFEI